MCCRKSCGSESYSTVCFCYQGQIIWKIPVNDHNPDNHILSILEEHLLLAASHC